MVTSMITMIGRFFASIINTGVALYFKQQCEWYRDTIIPNIQGTHKEETRCLEDAIKRAEVTISLQTTQIHKLKSEIIRLQNLLDQAVKESRTDPLTGLLNFNGMREAFHQQITLAQRTLKKIAAPFPDYCIMLIDLDRFKQINDTLGHHVGDSVLKAFADLMRGFFRDADLLHRYGGDEFVVVLPNIATNEAVRRAQEFCKKVNLHPTLAKQSAEISVSIGVAAINVSSNTLTIDKAYEIAKKHADTAMYEAKRCGRNTVSAA